MVYMTRFELTSLFWNWRKWILYQKSQSSKGPSWPDCQHCLWNKQIGLQQQGLLNACSWSGARLLWCDASPSEFIKQADGQAPSLEVLSQQARCGNHSIQGTLPDMTFKESMKPGLTLPFITRVVKVRMEGTWVPFVWDRPLCYQRLWVPNHCSGPSIYRWHSSGCPLQSHSSSCNGLVSFTHITDNLSACQKCNRQLVQVPRESREGHRQVHGELQPRDPRERPGYWVSIWEDHLS